MASRNMIFFLQLVEGAAAGILWSDKRVDSFGRSPMMFTLGLLLQVPLCSCTWPRRLRTPMWLDAK